MESRSLKSGVPAEIERAAKTHDKEKREKKKNNPTSETSKNFVGREKNKKQKHGIAYDKEQSMYITCCGSEWEGADGWVGGRVPAFGGRAVSVVADNE